MNSALICDEIENTSNFESTYLVWDINFLGSFLNYLLKRTYYNNLDRLYYIGSDILIFKIEDYDNNFNSNSVFHLLIF